MLKLVQHFSVKSQRRTKKNFMLGISIFLYAQRKFSLIASPLIKFLHLKFIFRSRRKINILTSISNPCGVLNYIICGTAWMEASHLSTTRMTVFRRYIKQPTLTIYFSRTSQGHNALPRPGLEPGSSDSEPSALTTGPLGVPAIQLTTHVKSGTLCGRTVVRS